MKNKPLFILAICLFCITGCSTTGTTTPPITPSPVQYSFTETEDMTAKLIFTYKDKAGVSLIDFEEKILPNPAENTYWEPIVLPAGRTLTLRVFVYWGEGETNRRRGIFNCPPLEKGKTYKLWYYMGEKHNEAKKLILTESDIERISYKIERKLFKGYVVTPLFEAVYIQEIPEFSNKELRNLWREYNN